MVLQYWDYVISEVRASFVPVNQLFVQLSRAQIVPEHVQPEEKYYIISAIFE